MRDSDKKRWWGDPIHGKQDAWDTIRPHDNAGKRWLDWCEDKNAQIDHFKSVGYTQEEIDAWLSESLGYLGDWTNQNDT